MKKTIVVKLEWVDDVKKFVNASMASNCNVMLKSGRYCVNGKSLLGVFSLDLSKPITVEIIGENENDIISIIKKFSIFNTTAC